MSSTQIHHFAPLPDVNFPVALAPMVGLSHCGLRALGRHYLPEGAITFWPTEMLNSRRLMREDLGFTEETLRTAEDDHLVPQLLGNEERPIAESIARLETWGIAGVDINMGCPVSKALRHNYGVALMGDSNYAAEVVRIATRATKKPVSVKLRAGLEADPQALFIFVKKLEAAGARYITLHPRLAGQKRRGFADWKMIRQVREQLSIPVVGNGDVQTADDVFAMMEQTGCQQVMVGRALVARPWLFWQVGERLGFAPPKGRTGPAPVTPIEEGAEYGRSLDFLLSCLALQFPPDVALRKFRFHLKTSHVWLKFGHALWAAVCGQKTVEGIARELRKFFATPQEMSPTTALRE
jgi:tRNA-dihydrouridine synthase